MTLVEAIAKDCAEAYDAEFTGSEQIGDGVTLFFKKGDSRYRVHVSQSGDEKAVAERIGWTLQ